MTGAANVTRKLGDIVKLPLLQREPSAKIAEIWAKYHANRADAIGRHLPVEHARLLTDRATPAPTFLYPVHRDAGHFMLLSQFQNRRHFIFTYLEDFKRNPAFARPHLTVTLHDDLAREKGIVLVRADIERAALTKAEADHTLTQLLDSHLIASRYASPTGLLAFNQTPATFDHEAYVRSYPRRRP